MSSSMPWITICFYDFIANWVDLLSPSTGVAPWRTRCLFALAATNGCCKRSSDLSNGTMDVRNFVGSRRSHNSETYSECALLVFQGRRSNATLSRRVQYLSPGGG
jgi:hypothetical protein